MTDDERRLAVTLTVAELRELVRAELRAVLQDGQPAARASKWVDVAVAAKYFGRTPQTIRNWIRAGAPARQIGTSAHPQFRIHLEEFDAWMTALHERRRRD